MDEFISPLSFLAWRNLNLKKKKKKKREKESQPVISSPGGAKHQLTLPACNVATGKHQCRPFSFRTELQNLL